MICMGNLNTITLAVKLHLLKHWSSSSVMIFVFNKEKHIYSKQGADFENLCCFQVYPILNVILLRCL